MTSSPADRDPLEKVAKRYRRFAHYEAVGVSPIYERWANAVAENEPARAFLVTLPREKQQPNLLFAAVRLLRPAAVEPADLLAVIGDDTDRLRALMLSRRVQTNEPARCATLLPVLASLPQPLALIEVGAAAGLCLIPDRYDYDYGRARLGATHAGAVAPPTFTCEVDAAAPLPATMPMIAWRAGLDLAPVDLGDPDAVSWLQALVWPEHRLRSERLASAIRVASAAPPTVRQGDLLDDLDRLVAEAPSDATIVVFHSAVLGYLPSREAIASFTDHVRELPVRWVSNEAPIANPELAGDDLLARAAGRFLLMLDRRPIAFTGPHGQSFELVDESSAVA